MRASAGYHTNISTMQGSKCFAKLKSFVNVQNTLLILNQMILSTFIQHTRYYQEIEQRPRKGLLKDSRRKIMTETSPGDISIYPSFLVWHILKYSNREVGRDTTQPHEFKWRMPWMPMVSVFPCCYQFIFSIWVLKRQMEVSPCPSVPPCFPPGDKGGQKSRKFWFLSTAHQGHRNTNQTAPTMPLCWQT